MTAQLDSGALVSSISIEGLLNQRESVVNQLRTAISLLADVNRFTEDAHMFTGSEYRRFAWIVDGANRSENSLLSHKSLPIIIKRLDSALWGKLMAESGLLSFMDSKARAEFREKIDKCETPELTHENIEETFKALYASRDDMFDRGVIRCFKALSWDYKTNNPFRFGKRIIVSYLRSFGSFNHRQLDDLDDLQRVLRVLDGKLEEDHRNGLSSRLRAAPGAYSDKGAGKHDDEYAEIKWFKNGNGHITFKRPDIVDKMNTIIAKHYPGALPAPT
jgi:hypothetical protein